MVQKISWLHVNIRNYLQHVTSWHFYDYFKEQARSKIKSDSTLRSEIVLIVFEDGKLIYLRNFDFAC
jgi:hypothetical protein